MERKCWRMPKAGSIERLQLTEETLPDPGEHEVTIEVKCIGLNFADIAVLHGLYSATPEGSFVPGLEYSGVVIKAGKSVSNLKAGDRVMGVTRFGGYASHLNIDHHYAIPLSDDWSFEEGAAFSVQALTAYYALFELGNLQENQTVLIHSGAGGVGILANRMAKRKKAFTIGTVGSADKVDFLLKEEGYDKVIVRDNKFSEKLQTALGGKELNIVLECIGGEILKKSYEAMAPMGRLIAFGSASFMTHGNKPNYFKLIWRYLKRPKIDPMKMPVDNKSIMGFNLIWLYNKVELMDKIMEKVRQLNIGKPFVGNVFPFEKLPDAVRLFQKGKTVGKVVVKVT